MVAFTNYGKHGRRPERGRAAAPAIGAVAVAAGIFALTQQPPDATTAQSDFVNEALVQLLGGIPGLYDAERNLWLGTDIRHWAHTAEFAALGALVAGTAAAAWPGARKLFLAGGSAAACAACSLLDQCHKLLVPGRHFDVLDLGMDALGYGLAIAIVLAVLAAGKEGR